MIIERALRGEFTLIAEIGVNYYEIAESRGVTPLEAAIEMIHCAKRAGIHAVKFQTYRAKNLAAAQSPAYWDRNEEPTASQRELFSRYDQFGEVEYTILARECERIGIDFLSTAFDFESAQYLSGLMEAFKVSSSDLTNVPFIRFQASLGKPMIISTGAADRSEIHTAVEAVRAVNSAPLVLMHCVLEYPTPYSHANLRRIESLRREFPEAVIGYSDHTRADHAPEILSAARALGAVVVEKHFTLDRNLRGNDHYHSMDQQVAIQVLQRVAFTDEIVGSGSLEHLDAEAPARLFARRSIVTAAAIRAGQVIDQRMITFKRPATGISPTDIDDVIGKRARRDLDEDTILVWDDLDSTER